MEKEFKRVYSNNSYKDKRELTDEEMGDMIFDSNYTTHTVSLEEALKDFEETGSNCNFKRLIDMAEDKFSNSNNGKKQTTGKLEYEIDFDFIKSIAERMQSNKGKYEPYNWKKPMDVEKLQQAMFRHVLEVMENNYEDDGRKHGHLEAIACNVMMILYQLKKY